MDLFSEKVRRDPYPEYAELRRNSPVWFDPAKKVWLISTYRDVCAVLRDADTFSASPASFESTLLGAPPLTHQRTRRVVGHAMTTGWVESLERTILQATDDLIEKMAAQKEADLVESFSARLPMIVVANFLGIKEISESVLRSWALSIISVGDSSATSADASASLASVTACNQFLKAHVERQIEQGHDRFISKCAMDPDRQAGLTNSELVDISGFMLVAGVLTTTNLITNALLLMLNYGLQKSFLERGGLIKSFIEEVLRFESPVQRTKRIALRPAILRGIEITEGALLEILIGSANRDPDVFYRPDEFQIERRHNPHVAFGPGPHFCLGAQLARLETKIAIEGFIRRFPDMALLPLPALTYGSELSLRGPTRLDVRLW